MGHLGEAELAVWARQLASGSDPPEGAAREHLASCPSCSDRLRQVQTSAEPDDVATRELRKSVPKPPPPAQALAAGARVGRYVMTGVLGQGGMGQVYAAVDPQLSRSVALKLLHPKSPGSASTQGQARLLREAQAMAQLSHPNVVAVFDVGTFEDRIFVAMELVEGQTLKQWLRQEQRSWKSVLPLLLQAGKGLAAAHKAGLVHRDFKPDNVLLGNDGRVRVTDFGLARAQGVSSDSDPGPQHPVVGAEPSGSHPALSGSLLTPLTEAGIVMGTPGYVAPEQLLGEPGDARADQFSFCVSAFEALYGRRPFLGRGFPEYAKALREETPAPLKERQVPAWVARAVLRGLAKEPAHRFPDMESLVATLSKDPVRRATRLALGAAVLVTLATTSTLSVRAIRHPPPAGCEAPAQALANVWGDVAREGLRRRFLSTGAPGADQAAASTVRALDTYVAEFRQEQAEACSRLASAKSMDELPVIEMACLRRQAEEVTALIAVLAGADSDIVRNASGAMAILVSATHCADPRTLAQIPKPPSDPALRAEVQALRARVATGAVLTYAGKTERAIAMLEPVVSRAEQLRYRPLLAEALFSLGFAQEDLSNARAVETLTRAEEVSEGAGLDGLAARSAALLVRELVWGSGKPAEAKAWAKRAEILQERNGNDPLSGAILESSLSGLADAEGDYAQEIAHSQKALALRTQTHGPHSATTLQYLTNLGMVQANAHRYPEAIETLKRARHEIEQNLGPDSAKLSQPLLSLCYAWSRTGQLAGAESACSRAEEVIRKHHSEDGELGLALLEVRARLRMDQRRFSESIEMGREAERQAIKLDGPGSQDRAWALTVQGESLVALGRPREATVLLERAIETFEKAESSQAPDLVYPLVDLAAARNDLLQFEAAQAAVARALKMLSSFPPDPGQLAWARFQLARALGARRRDTPHARELAVQARDDLDPLPWKQAQAEQVHRWLAGSSGPRGFVQPP